MLCISRYTNDTYAQQFGDGYHKFYLEFRCNRPCVNNMNTCATCAEKSSTTLQYSRKFNHGNVNEPIPDKSHIFGGKWYYAGVRKWGEPPSEIIEFALQYQKEARSEFITNESSNSELNTLEEESISKEMPQANKKSTVSSTPIKRCKKPTIAPETPVENMPPKPVKRIKKPKIVSGTPIETPIETTSIPEPKKSTSHKRTTDTPYSSLINNKNQLVHKEVSLPTHIETELEQIDSEGYQIEYIQLSLFEANGVSYYRDIKKNKLYKKNKDKGIGSYVGRWNPDTDLIITNIPDSDDEE